jgi:cell division protein DivIC
MDTQFYRKNKRRSRARQFFKRLLKNKRLVIGIVIALPLLIVLIFGNRGVLQRVKLENQKTELEQKIKHAEEETKQLQAESKVLEGDPATIEKVAREKYGMVREGEKVYKVNSDK